MVHFKNKMSSELVKQKLQKTLDDFCNYTTQRDEGEYEEYKMEEFKYELERLNLLVEFILEKNIDDELYKLQSTIPSKLKLIYMFA